MDGDRRLEVESPGVGMLATVQAAIANHGLGVPLSETSTLSSDHNAFRSRGFLAAGLTEEFVGGDTTPYYHSFGDTYDTVDFDYLASSTQVLFALVSDLVAAE
jgi:Zn-dependent M28 family amino/carboxypeptidase